MAVASFSLAPDAAVDLAWKLGLSLRWLAQDTNGGSSGMSMLGNALRDGRDRRGRRGPHPRRRRHRACRLRQGRGELQHRDAEAPVAARPRRAERRLCAGGEPPDQEVRPGEIRLRPHRHRATRMGGEESVRGLSRAADDGGVSRRALGRRSAVALRLRAGGGGRAGDHRGAARPRAEGPAGRARPRASRQLQLRQPGGRRAADRHQHVRQRAVAGGRRAAGRHRRRLDLRRLSDHGAGAGQRSRPHPRQRSGAVLPRHHRRAAFSGEHLGRHVVAPASRAATPAG